jgi:serine protease Do
MAPSTRARFGAAVAAAFLGGVLLTAAFDLTPFGYAQQSGTARPAASEVRSLAETGDAFSSIAESVTPAVVSISAEATARQPSAARQRQMPPGWEDFFRQFGGPPQQQPRQSSGTGFLVSADGYILTNNHVVADADRLRVRLNDGREFSARLVGRDPDTDVAVIKIDGKDFPRVALGDDTKLRIGEWVVAIGNPLGLDFTVTAGIVSAKGRSATDVQLPTDPRTGGYEIVDLIQTDAAINPGNSGGPLVNIRGEVIGINNAIASQTGYFAGYGFAIPVTLARDVMEDLIKHGRVRRAVIGVTIRDVNPDDAGVAGLRDIRGAVVGDFSSEDSPAQRAGLQRNDVIVAIDGKAVDRVSTLQRIVRAHEPGETVGVDVMRYGERKSFRVRLAEAPAQAQVAAATPPREERTAGTSAEKLGVVVAPVPAELVRVRQLDSLPPGVLVAEVSPDGPARERLAPGVDVIQEVVYPVRRQVRTPQDLQSAIADLKPGDYLSLGVLRTSQNQRLIVNLRVGRE